MTFLREVIDMTDDELEGWLYNWSCFVLEGDRVDNQSLCYHDPENEGE
jgi:hypothetical protein